MDRDKTNSDKHLNPDIIRHQLDLDLHNLPLMTISHEEKRLQQIFLKKNKLNYKKIVSKYLDG